MSGKAWLLAVALGAMNGACETDTRAAGVNGPCTRSKNCIDGLACLRGVCTPTNAGLADDGGGDSGDADMSDADAAE